MVQTHLGRSSEEPEASADEPFYHVNLEPDQEPVFQETRFFSSCMTFN